MRNRHVTLVLMVALAIVTFLDRIAIAVASPRMQAELHIPPERWGWVLGAFVPTGSSKFPRELSATVPDSAPSSPGS
jgi:hypothetical protein